MAFLGTLDIVGSAITAESYRTTVILQNISNARTTDAGDGEPYRRKQVVFSERPLTFEQALAQAKGGVRISQVVESERDFQPVYDPDHPLANEAGYVLYPNVDTTEEMVDLMQASNAYDSNLTALGVVKAMINKTLNLK